MKLQTKLITLQYLLQRWNHYIRTFTTAQLELSEPVLTVKRPCATRWSSLSESVTSLSRTYSGILAYLKMETTTQAESLLAALESWNVLFVGYSWRFSSAIQNFPEKWPSNSLTISTCYKHPSITKSYISSNIWSCLEINFKKFNSAVGESLILNGQQLSKDPEHEHYLCKGFSSSRVIWNYWKSLSWKSVDVLWLIHHSFLHQMKNLLPM